MGLKSNWFSYVTGRAPTIFTRYSKASIVGFILKAMKMLTSHMKVLPSGCVLLCYMLPDQLFLQPQILHNRAQPARIIRCFLGLIF
jgi:hypothetical protein